MAFGDRPLLSILFNSWWVVAFCSLAAISYAHAHKEKERAIDELEFRIAEMEKEKVLALADKEELADRIASQGDPAWIELVLLKELGVVPEGFLKVHFTK